MRILIPSDTGEEQIHDVHLPSYKGATNNQMELQACIAALQQAAALPSFPSFSRIVIHTDSLYVTENYQKAMFQWPKTRWCLASGAPVLNTETWKLLVKAIRQARKRVEFRWVRGHAKNEHNKAVDRLARHSAQNPLNKPLAVVNVRRKRSPRSVEPGSVPMLGQRLTVHIVTAQYLATHRLWKCKYEVLSHASPHFQCVDNAFSSHLLRADHSYHVRLGRNARNPTIEEVFREVDS